MKMYLRFLGLIAFLYCSVGFSSTLTLGGLPEMVKRIEPAVVVILTYDDKGEALGQGSGFFISQCGDVITNRHVLSGASRAEVKIAEGKVYPIKQVRAEDKDGDLIRVSVDIPAKAVSLLTVSTSTPQAGERVFIIGNPLGLEKTVSDGIISAVREIPGFGKIIQTTAPVSAGSSGSPVTNMKGEVIGVATFIILEGQNLNFAIPGERIAGLTPGKGQTLAEWQSAEAEEEFNSAEELYRTGLIYLWTKKYEKALTYFEEAVEKNPDYAEAYFQIGYCNNELGLYEEAIESFKQAIRINPDDAEPHYNLGMAYSKLGRYQEEIEAYKQAIRINPDDAKAHCNLGTTYGNLGRYQEAIEAYKQAIRIKPDDADAHYNLGLAYLMLGDNGSALDQYKILKRP